MSDLAIRNLFIIPTIVFLIVFNIFPLIYSLGYSFTDFRASMNAPAHFVGLQNYRELLADEYIWNNFTLTAKYVLVSVGGQVLVGFGVALLLNRPIPGQGPADDAAAAADDDVAWPSSACSGSCSTARPGASSTTLLGLGDFAWLSDPDVALYAVAITDIWMWSPFVMLLSLAGLVGDPAAPVRGRGDRPRRRAGSSSRRITLPLVAPLLLIAVIFRTMEAFKTFDIAYVMTQHGRDRADRDQALQDGVSGVADRPLLRARLHVLMMVLAITNIYVKYLNRVKAR